MHDLCTMTLLKLILAFLVSQMYVMFIQNEGKIVLSLQVLATIFYRTQDQTGAYKQPIANAISVPCQLLP